MFEDKTLKARVDLLEKAYGAKAYDDMTHDKRAFALDQAVSFWMNILDNVDKFETKDIDINENALLNTASRFLEFLEKGK